MKRSQTQQRIDMIQLHIATESDIKPFTHLRAGETKLGETLQLCDSLDDVVNNNCTYVLFGICEDIGIRANYGKPGAVKAWGSFIKALVNVQDNQFNNGNDILLLGHIAVSPDIDDIDKEHPETLGSIVARIDSKVATVVNRIVSAGKIPIVIGGGHNNAYGNIKGTATALQKAINVINFDAHTDLRKTEYRHSGNGFTYALESENSYLNTYCIFGLHKNYTPQYIYNMIATSDHISVFDMEDMLLESKQVENFETAISQLSDNTLCIEIDVDSIANFSSSAQTPSGFNLEVMRYFLGQLARKTKCGYLHICEAAPTKKNYQQVGKALSYLVTDFIRNHREYYTL